MEGSRTLVERQGLVEALPAIYCVSGFVWERFLEGLSEDGGKVHTVHNGMDIARLPPQRDRRPIVFFAGQITPHKGIGELIKAFRLACPSLPGWSLVIAGRDRMGLFAGDNKELSDEIAAIGDRVTYLGLLGHDDVMGMFTEAEISVVPTITPEPLGRTAQEAMACGSALITSGTGGIKESVGEAAMIVDPSNSGLFADAIVALAKDSGLRKRFQTEGARRMADMFDIRTVAKRLDDLREHVARLGA
jgi:UDP-glucose:(glucosyl)LPS alpha-1,2-glucosyltransferase